VVADGDKFTLLYDRTTGLMTAQHNGVTLLTTSGGTVSDSTYATETSLAAGFGFEPENLNQRAINTFTATGVSSSPSWVLPATHTIAAKQPMILVYPRPDTETPAYARHRKAFYDGAHSI